LGNYSDSIGKEIQVKALGKSVGVFRTDNVKFSLRWIAIFTTASDCSKPFDWLGGISSTWRVPIRQVSYINTGRIFATIDDCAVHHGMLKLADGSPLPGFITYDIPTQDVSVEVSASQLPG
jgi:hypothetical protein